MLFRKIIAVCSNVHTKQMHTYCVYIHTYIHAYAHTYIHLKHIYTYILTYTHIYMHTYMHTYIHTYIHTLIVSIPLCYEYDIQTYFTIFSLTQLNFFIIDIY
jgi:hypothetical protein